MSVQDFDMTRVVCPVCLETVPGTQAKLVRIGGRVQWQCRECANK